MVAAARELPVGSIRLIVKATHSFFRDKEIDEFFVSLFYRTKKRSVFVPHYVFSGLLFPLCCIDVAQVPNGRVVSLTVKSVTNIVQHYCFSVAVSSCTDCSL